MNMVDVRFKASYQRESACPKDGKPEFAFIGRSNVGKSSLINMLTNKKSLAKVSVTPGKTQLINYFDIDETWYLVDLPGYGYAKTSKQVRQGFQPMIETYLKHRENLVVAFVLIDCRHSLQKIDKDFINWCGANSVPFSLIFTKADKLGKEKRANNIQAIKNELLLEWNELPLDFITSSEDKTGREEVLQYIQTLLQQALTK